MEVNKDKHLENVLYFLLELGVNQIGGSTELANAGVDISEYIDKNIGSYEVPVAELLFYMGYGYISNDDTFYALEHCNDNGIFKGENILNHFINEINNQ